MKVLIALIASVSAFWPFDSSLDLELSKTLLERTFTELGASSFEASLITKAYLEKNQEITLKSLVETITDNKFSKFVRHWKLDLFKTVISQELLIAAANLQDLPLSYDLYKALTMSYEEYNQAKVRTQATEEEKQAVKCPDGTKLLYRI
ncbi:hypothetical protein SteCoe_13021 [Stentor coeruleus]|uniref:Uncharacterized protein n=1 Tax=Stentor coeruleus TaxID=5963 RepID=A0A1R2C9C8_9CILI|nr:hypothetical protein SteCoe_13021 [Stentor coeruleus]